MLLCERKVRLLLPVVERFGGRAMAEVICLLKRSMQRGIASVERLGRAQDYWLSIDRFVNWSDTASGKNDFYSDYKIKQMYKAHLRTFTSRVNTINGRKYSEDPTIYYWNLLNEPRWCAH